MNHFSDKAAAGPRALGSCVFPVLFLTVVFFGNFSGRLLAGPLLPAMEHEMGLSHLQSGIMVLMTGIGLFFGQIGAAFLAGKKGYRYCILMSLWGSAAAAVAVALLKSTPALYAAFIGLGITGGLYIPSGIALITAIIESQDWGKAMGIHELAPNLALIFTPFLATLALSFGS